jgi:hypothetical protein
MEYGITRQAFQADLALGTGASETGEQPEIVFPQGVLQFSMAVKMTPGAADAGKDVIVKFVKVMHPRVIKPDKAEAVGVPISTEQRQHRLELKGATLQVSEPEPFSAAGIHSIKIVEVQNGSAAQALAGVNVFVSY